MLMRKFFKNLFDKIREFQAPFKVNEKCTLCGVCIKTCPTQTIKMENKKIVFMFDKCIGCKACVRTCSNKGTR